MAEESGQKKRLEVHDIETDVKDETCKTFVFHNEDHTLGNSLTYMLNKNPDVEFSGYSIPHPYDDKINLRISTKGIPATAALNTALTNVSTVCDHVLKTFENAVRNFKETRNEQNMDVDDR